ncbi:hypothetical protein JCM6882_002371 [Rhodosporidiobolus microsporus]
MDMSSLFSSLPGYNPLMNTNLSEVSATRRLLQLPMFGIFQGDVRPKFSKPDHATTDISPEDKKLFGNTVKAMDKVFDADPKLKAMNWTPVLYIYELYKGHAKHAWDFGHLVFVDNTVTRYLLVRTQGSVKCANGHCPLDHDYAEITELQAQQFFNLTTYLPIPEPKWVRATFTTDEHRAVVDDLFDFRKGDTGLSTRPTQGLKPAVIHVTSANMKPMFSQDDLDTIDAFLESCSQKVPGKDVKKKVLVPAGGKAKEFSPTYLPEEFAEEPKRNCGNCGEPRLPKDLSRCGGCKSVFYCDRKCQVEHWKYHKAACKPKKTVK